MTPKLTPIQRENRQKWLASMEYLATCKHYTSKYIADHPELDTPEWREKNKDGVLLPDHEPARHDRLVGLGRIEPDRWKSIPLPGVARS